MLIFVLAIAGVAGYRNIVITLADLALLAGKRRKKLILDRQYRPDGYNIGINNLPAAGQTIPHVHIHLIPRYQGDVPRPQGGIRGVIPAMKEY
jgi:diadenosine tetraphosphate (Ap4A) HIT family hydrolase